MKIVKNPDPKAVIKVPPNSRIPIETSDNMFSHHGIILALGKRQSGKSVWITNYLRMLKDEGKADRILVVSPTIESNKALLDSLGVEAEDIFDPDDPEATNKIKQTIESERDEYETYLERKKKWKELQKLLKTHSVSIDQIDPYLLLEFADELGQLTPPVAKYKQQSKDGDRPPIIHVFCDDCQSSGIFRDKKFLNATIRHRHLGGLKGGGALGCSLYIAIQNLKAQAGGCPRAIRNNCTQMVIVGKSKDEQELKDIYSSIAGEVEYEHFEKAYNYATAEPHSSLVIDLHPKKTHASRFRKNLNEYICV